MSPGERRSNDRLWFACPKCGWLHGVRVREVTSDGDSILIRLEPESRCCTFAVQGGIQFLKDLPKKAAEELTL